MSLRGFLAAALVTVSVLAAQTYRDEAVISSLRAQVSASRRFEASVLADRAEATAHESRIMQAAVGVLGQYRVLKAAADRCQL